METFIHSSTAYGYDQANNLTSLQEPGGDCTQAGNSLCTTLGMTANNRRNSVAFPNGVNVSIVYDKAGHECIVDATGPAGQILESLGYSYGIYNSRATVRHLHAQPSLSEECNHRTPRTDRIHLVA